MRDDFKEREKLSWSEIDKKKDRSGHTSSRRDRPERQVSSPHALNKYKEKLEQIFSPESKLGKDAQEKLKKLQSLSDRNEFCEAAKQYVTEHGFPETWSELETFLRHRDTDILRETIVRLKTLVAEQSETRRGNFIKDLRLIEMTTRDKELRKEVIQHLRELDAPPAV